MDLRFNGAIVEQDPKLEPSIPMLRNKWPLKRGDIFRQAAWESAKRCRPVRSVDPSPPHRNHQLWNPGNCSPTLRDTSCRLHRALSPTAFSEVESADAASQCAKRVVEIAKLRDYCLSTGHPEGRHKARVFHSVLGLTAQEAEKLQAALFATARENEAIVADRDAYGRGSYLLRSISPEHLRLNCGSTTSN